MGATGGGRGSLCTGSPALEIRWAARFPMCLFFVPKKEEKECEKVPLPTGLDIMAFPAFYKRKRLAQSARSKLLPFPSLTFQMGFLSSR